MVATVSHRRRRQVGESNLPACYLAIRTSRRVLDDLIHPVGRKRFLPRLTRFDSVAAMQTPPGIVCEHSRPNDLDGNTPTRLMILLFHVSPRKDFFSDGLELEPSLCHAPPREEKQKGQPADSWQTAPSCGKMWSARPLLASVGWVSAVSSVLSTCAARFSDSITLLQSNYITTSVSSQTACALFFPRVPLALSGTHQDSCD